MLRMFACYKNQKIPIFINYDKNNQSNEIDARNEFENEVYKKTGVHPFIKVNINIKIYMELQGAPSHLLKMQKFILKKKLNLTFKQNMGINYR